MRGMQKFFVALCCLAGFAAMSCSNSAGGGDGVDDMVEEYNSDMDSVNMVITETQEPFRGVRELESLIPADSYDVPADGIGGVDAGGGYSFYDWQLVNSSGESVADYSGATRNSHIGIRAGLSPGIPAGTYTLHLTVTNVKGEKFHDSAQISIR